MGRQRRAKDRKRLRRFVEGQESQTAPDGRVEEIMVCECGKVYRYGRGAWIPVTEGEAHSHVLRFARAVV